MAALSDAAHAFAAATPTADAAEALKGLPEAELLALVAHLTGERARAHLEVLGAAAVPKKAKKAARAAAYKLKSAGVAGEVAPRAAAIDLSAFVDLDRVAVIGAPGLDGQTWLLLAQLPGTPGVEFDVKPGDEPVRIEVEDELGRGRLRKLHESLQGGRAVLAGADLAVRFIDRVGEQLAARPGGAPASFVHLERWRTEAIRHGADGARCDARAALGEIAQADEAQVEALFDELRVGYLVPPPDVSRTVEQALGRLVHEDAPIAEEAFRAECAEVFATAVEIWSEKVAPSALADMLDLDGDLLFSVGERAGAAAALGLADALRDPEGGAERAASLRLAAVSRAFDLDAAWQHRAAHIAGDAHHDH